MRLLLLSNKAKETPFLHILRRERIYYDLLPRASFIEHSPFYKRIYNGVIFDGDLVEHSSLADMAMLALLKKVLPYHITLADPGLSQDLDLANFFKICQRFPPRSFRQQKRVDISLPASFSSNADFGDPRKAITLNVSPNGCFLTNSLKQEIGDKVWLNLNTLEDSSPLLSEIRWFSKDARAGFPPGMGVRFLEARSNQIEQLDWLIQQGSTPNPEST